MAKKATDGRCGAEVNSNKRDMHLLSTPLGCRQLLPKVQPLQVRQLAFHVSQALVQQVSRRRWHGRI